MFLFICYLFFFLHIFLIIWGSPRWDLESVRVPPHRLIVSSCCFFFVFYFCNFYCSRWNCLIIIIIVRIIIVIIIIAFGCPPQASVTFIIQKDSPFPA